MRLNTERPKLLTYASLSSSEVHTIDAVLSNPSISGAKDELAGHWSLAIDPKNRMQIPSATRKYFKKCGIYVVFNPLGKFSLITGDDFRCLKEALLKLTPASSEDRLKLVRWLTISTRQLKIDSAGRVALPQETISLLFRHVPIDKKCRKNVLLVASNGRLLFEKVQVQPRAKLIGAGGLQNLSAPKACRRPRAKRGGAEIEQSREVLPIQAIT